MATPSRRQQLQDGLDKVNMAAIRSDRMIPEATNKYMLDQICAAEERIGMLEAEQAQAQKAALEARIIKLEAHVMRLSSRLLFFETLNEANDHI